MAWEIDPRSDDNTIIIKRVVAGGGGAALLVLFLLGEVFKWISENWVYIVIILGIAIICAIVCFIIYANSLNSGLKIFISIIISIGLIIGVLYFRSQRQDGAFNSSNQKTGSQYHTETNYAYVRSDALNIRTGPSSDYGVAGHLQKNTRVEVIDNSGQWWKIQAGNVIGYVNSKYLQY